MPSGLRKSVPLKITSAISPPRNAFADCSPKTHRMASEIFDFPHPFGPTIAATPGTKLRLVLSAKDLKPRAVKLLRYMTGLVLAYERVICKAKKHIILWSQT